MSTILLAIGSCGITRIPKGSSPGDFSVHDTSAIKLEYTAKVKPYTDDVNHITYRYRSLTGDRWVMVGALKNHIVVSLLAKQDEKYIREKKTETDIIGTLINWNIVGDTLLVLAESSAAGRNAVLLYQYTLSDMKLQKAKVLYAAVPSTKELLERVKDNPELNAKLEALTEKELVTVVGEIQYHEGGWKRLPEDKSDTRYRLISSSMESDRYIAFAEILHMKDSTAVLNMTVYDRNSSEIYRYSNRYDNTLLDITVPKIYYSNEAFYLSLRMKDSYADEPPWKQLHTLLCFSNQRFTKTRVVVPFAAKWSFFLFPQKNTVEYLTVGRIKKKLIFARASPDFLHESSNLSQKYELDDTEISKHNIDMGKLLFSNNQSATFLPNSGYAICYSLTQDEITEPSTQMGASKAWSSKYVTTPYVYAVSHESCGVFFLNKDCSLLNHRFFENKEPIRVRQTRESTHPTIRIDGSNCIMTYVSTDDHNHNGIYEETFDLTTGNTQKRKCIFDFESSGSLEASTIGRFGNTLMFVPNFGEEFYVYKVQP